MVGGLKKTFRSIDVWRRVSASSVYRYRCFKNIETCEYCVQSRDVYSNPIQKGHMEMLERNFVDLMVEEDPDVRSGSFGSLEAAIEAFDSHLSASHR